MTRNFTFFAALILATMSIFAQKPLRYSSNEATGSFLKSRFGQHDNRSERNPAERKNGIKYDLSNTKSAEVIKQRLDRLTYQEYDAISGQWITDDKEEYSYDASLNNTYENDYSWDENANQWINDWRSENAYDASGNLIQEIHSSLNDVSNQFFVSSKRIYTYDANGNLMQEIIYRMDDLTSQLLVNDKYDYSYDVSGNLTQRIRYELNESSQLTEYEKNNFSYDGNGREILELSTFWAETTWGIPSSKNESTYNSNGNLILYALSFWDELNNKWYDPNAKTEYTYNANGKLTQEFEYIRSSSSSSWEPRSKEDFIYDDNGNNSQYISYYDWNAQTGKWTNVWKDEYSYNNSYTYNDLILPYWWIEELSDFQHMITEIKGYEWNIYTLTWIPDYKATLEYSEQTYTSVSPKGKDLVNIYPNPFTEAVSIKLPASYSKITFDLFDQQGHKVMTKQISSNEKLSLEGFSKGIYLYKLNIDGKIQSGKLVKK